MSTPTKVTWTDPTTNTDGSPITAGEITGYEIGVRDTTAAGSLAGVYPYSAKAPVSATSEPFGLLQPVLPTGVLLAAAVRADTVGEPSAWTPEITFTLPKPAPIPNPPTGFSVA